MMLRSSTVSSAQAVDTCITVGSFVELCSEDSTEKPWLARIVNIRTSDIQATDLECEWLWHPKESIRDYKLVKCDPNTYGPREVFLSSSSLKENNNTDWNPVDSVKWQVYVFPLEEYKTIAANGFQMQLPSQKEGGNVPHGNGSIMVLLEGNRCWYYRQTLDIERQELKPHLDLVIHRPNPEYHKWCATNNVSLTSNISSSSFETPIPSRTILVPENPERMYFKCSSCQRRFETRQGDCLNPSSVNDQKHFRLKPQICQPDIEFICPYCNIESSTSDAENLNNVTTHNVAKRTRYSLFRDIRDSETHNDIPNIMEELKSDAKSSSRESNGSTFEQDGLSSQGDLLNRRQSARYNRFFTVFKRSVEECLGLEDLQYSDPKTLCDEFLQCFEEYASQDHLTAKMCHQKLHEIFQNLKRENNIDLRRRVVTGEFPLSKLVRSEAKDLAPESLKKRREEEAHKYFLQQVLLQPDSSAQKIFRKTHKGLEALDEDDDMQFLQDNSGGVHPKHVMGHTAELTQHHLPPNEAHIQKKMTAVTTPKSLKEIFEFVQNNHTKDYQMNLVHNLDYSLNTNFKHFSKFFQDNQLETPLSNIEIPNAEQTLSLLKTKLDNEACAKEKLLSDLNKYYDLMTQDSRQ